MGIRFAFLIGIVGIAYGVLGFHLYTLQVSRGGQLLAQAESQYVGLSGSDTTRGAIYFIDKNGGKVLAAMNKDFPLIYAVPSAIEDPLEAAHALASLLGIDAAGFADKFSHKSSTYVLIQKKADPALAQKVSELNMKGIYVASLPSRFYPFGDRASQLLGFVAPNTQNNGESGRYGVEKQYNDEMLGSAAAGIGQDMTLTIDPAIQIEAERILDDLIVSSHSKGGTVIVEEPATGKILALGNNPTFDPNHYSDFGVDTFLNAGVEKIYEPGSVFKVLTMATGLDTGKITPQTTFNDTGILKVSGKKIQNWDLKAHGLVTMTNVIELSLNTGAAFAERKIGDALFTEYIKKFGFGEKTGVDLPGELKGDVRNLSPKSPAVTFATASFGQGVAVTPLQLINAISAIANGGTLMRPYVNAALAPSVIREVIGAEAAKQTTAMMVSAVDKAQVAKINGYSIAGKTGTAEVPDFVHGGYLDMNQSVIDTYVGFGPMTNPKFVILIKINEPVGAVLAGETVVPAFRNLAQFILNYYNIPPDRIQ